MSLLFNMLSRLVIAFLPRSKCLLISWLQSSSLLILEPKKIKSVTVSICSPSILQRVKANRIKTQAYYPSEQSLEPLEISWTFLRNKQQDPVPTNDRVWRSFSWLVPRKQLSPWQRCRAEQIKIQDAQLNLNFR